MPECKVCKMPEKKLKKECIEWKADGTCARWVLTEEKELQLDVSNCPDKERERIISSVVGKPIDIKTRKSK